MNEALPDLLDCGLTLVFCGTAASDISARQGAYYANPSNAFWSTLHVAGLTARLFAPSEFRELIKLKIGLTDLAKYAAGSDRRLRLSDFNVDELSAKIQRFQPQILAFTSKTAWRVWTGTRCEQGGRLRLARRALGEDAIFRLAVAFGGGPRLLGLVSLARIGAMLIEILGLVE